MQVNYHGIPDCYFDERDYYDDTKPPIIYAPFNASPDVLRNNCTHPMLYAVSSQVIAERIAAAGRTLSRHLF